MTCKTCNTRNPIGNKFCRECGEKMGIPEGTLAAEEAARAENERRIERAATLLTDAHQLAEQGKYLSAIAIAEEVAQLLPQSTSALSLLATLFEHTDQPERAIKAQERIVALNPDSPADVLRLERLKRGERTSAAPRLVQTNRGSVPTLRGGSVPLPSGAPAPVFPSWFPYAASAVGCGFILFLGMLAMTPGSALKPHNQAAPAIGQPLTAAAPAITDTPSPLPYNPAAQPPPLQDATHGGDPFVPLNDTRRALQADAAQRGAANLLPQVPQARIGSGTPIVRPAVGPVIVSSDILKTPADRARSNDDTAPLPPIAVTAPTGDTGNSNSGAGFGDGQRVAAAPPTAATAASNENDSDSKPAPTGYMRIQVGPPTAHSAPIVASAPRAPEHAADMDGDPLRRARTLEGMGRYSDAISSYREAIAAGASAGDANQAIGLCYQRLNDAGNAQTAYRQAISAYQSQITQGRSAAAAQRGINSSKAALEVLSGQ